MGEPDESSTPPRAGGASGTPISRRTVLRGAGVAGAAVGLGAAAVGPSAPRAAAADDWGWFRQGVEDAFRRMDLVGAAVALVTSAGVQLVQPLGRREQRRPRPTVGPTTRFLVASTTKSMSSLLAATYVDQGRFGWDDPARTVWPGFRAPTPELTESLRVRDLFGMATGIDEPPALSALHEGDPTAEQLLQSLTNLPVAASPDTRWIYNNTVYVVGGYLPLLHEGTPPARLAGTYTNAMQQRVFGPAGMTGSRIIDDPRGVVDDAMRGHGLDLRADVDTLNYGAVGSYAPVGGALSSVQDMAAYVQMQLRGGVSASGHRVVSAANLAECWTPHVPVPFSPELDPSVRSSGYGMGWIRNTFADGTSLVWHNGAIDGFTAYIGFLPERDLGLVVLNAMNPVPTGTLFYTYVLNLLLSEKFGLNKGVTAVVERAYDEAVAGLRALGRQTRPVSARAVEPWLGHYEGGWQVVHDSPELHLLQGSRDIPLRALSSDTALVMCGGLLVEQKVNLGRDVDGTPTLELVGLETVRRTVGPA